MSLMLGVFQQTLICAFSMSLLESVSLYVCVVKDVLVLFAS